jgi:hypothetical protein
VRRRAALAALLLGACAEIRQKPRLPVFGDASADPVRTAMAALPIAFAEQGRSLAGQPVATALAAARLEYVVAALQRDPRYSAVPQGVVRDMLLARNELRTALDMAPDLAPPAAVAALTAAARALEVGDTAAAAGALTAPGFRPGGAGSVARLADLGPVPQASLAAGELQGAVEMLDASNGWLKPSRDEAPGLGVVPFGLGGYPSASF